MSEVTLHPAGLASLLSALQPRAAADVSAADAAAERAAVWADGFAAGEAAADAALAPVRQQLADAAAAFEAACVIDADRLRPLLAALVRQVAEAVLMAELRASHEALLPLAAAALAAVRPGEAATLRAHSETLARLLPHLPDIATSADAALAADGFAITGSDFAIDIGVAARLDDVMTGLL